MWVHVAGARDGDAEQIPLGEAGRWSMKIGRRARMEKGRSAVAPGPVAGARDDRV